MNKIEDGYLSVIGTSFLHPIVYLYEELCSNDTKGPNEVQASSVENGMSCSIIILMIALVESLLNRTRHIMEIEKKITINKSNRSVVGFYKKIIKKVKLNEELEELFALRDVILHNHVWDASILSDENGMRFTEAPNLKTDTLYGDKKFNNVLNDKTKCSNLLGLNLFPTRIWRKDTKIVLKTSYMILKSIEDINRSYCYISHQPIEFKGEYYQLEEFIEKIDIILENKK